MQRVTRLAGAILAVGLAVGGSVPPVAMAQDSSPDPAAGWSLIRGLLLETPHGAGVRAGSDEPSIGSRQGRTHDRAAGRPEAHGQDGGAHSQRGLARPDRARRDRWRGTARLQHHVQVGRHRAHPKAPEGGRQGRSAAPADLARPGGRLGEAGLVGAAHQDGARDGPERQRVHGPITGRANRRRPPQAGHQHGPRSRRGHPRLDRVLHVPAGPHLLVRRRIAPRDWRMPSPPDSHRAA